MILLLESVHAEAHEVLERAGKVVVAPTPTDIGEGLAAEEIRAVVTRGLGRVDSELLERLPNLEVVARCGAGLDNIDTARAEELGIVVVHTPGRTTAAVAELATLLMLAGARLLEELSAGVRRGEWSVRDGYEGVELGGKRMGVVGLGAIGTRVGEIGLVLDMDVVGWTRRSGSLPFPRLELDELFQTSDVIQICVASTPETDGLIGPSEFSQLKQGALLINTARGRIVDHEALRAALESGQVGAYAADVWDPEPPRLDDELIRDPRVLLTPHVAAFTDVTYRDICVSAATAAAAVLEGQAPDRSCVFAG
ncbi:MAG: NAD(P)-dependent oxidoreductase [Acidimicrobiales bacterium]